MKKFFGFLIPILVLSTTLNAAYIVKPGTIDTAKIADGSITRAKLASGASSKKLIVSATTGTTLDPTTTDVLNLSSTSFNVTLPTSVGLGGYTVEIVDNGTSLTATYCIVTTSAQTVGGIASGSYCLNTNGESLTLMSDNANWIVKAHKTKTDIISAGTVAISATTAYTFTIPSSSITVGTIYTNNGCTFTVSATTATSTNINASGTCNPTTTGTLTYVSGSPSGNLTFSARTITGVPVIGTATTNLVRWYRDGRFAIITYIINASASASAAGVGDYIYYFPVGLFVDTSLHTPFLTSLSTFLENPPGSALATLPASISIYASAGYLSVINFPVLYSSNSFRWASSGISLSGTIGSSFSSYANAQWAMMEFKAPILGWQP